MRWTFFLVASLIVGVRAFAPTPIRWVGLPARKFVVVPGASLNEGFASNGKISLPASLTISEQPGRTSPREIPHFHANPDKTIAWHATKLCLEANGEKSGDEVRVNYCDAGPAQQWEVLPSSLGRQSWIKLGGANKCAIVADERSLNRARIELRTCENRAPEWMFEGSVPVPKEGNSQGVAVSPPIKPVMTSVFAMIALVGLSLTASLCRVKKERSAWSVSVSQDVLPWNADGAGVCLTKPSATLDVGMQGMSPAVMALSPASDSTWNLQGMNTGLRVSAIVPDVSQHMLNDAELQLLADIVNGAYAVGEKGMWKDDVVGRTNPKTLADQLKDGKLILLHMESSQDESKAAEPTAGDGRLNIIGCVYLDFDYKDTLSKGTGAGPIVKGVESPHVAEFGMLAVADEHLGKSLGNFLITAAESYARAKGCESIRCEILSPKSWEHPMKVRLDEWYRRLGYVKQEEDRFDVFSNQFPDIVNALACPCKFEVYLKALDDAASEAEESTSTVDRAQSEAGFVNVNEAEQRQSANDYAESEAARMNMFGSDDSSDDSSEWDATLEKLTAYKVIWGNANAPLKSELGDWCKEQRKLHASGNLASNRALALERLGFSWRSPSDVDDPLTEHDWEDMCSRLRAYRQKQQSTDVPKKYKPDPHLGGWVAAVRRCRSLLGEARIAELDELGFQWTSSRQCGSFWKITYRQLRSFRQEHGHTDVARVLGEEHALSQWCEAQRTAWRESRLSRKRIVYLDEVHFEYEAHAM